MLRALIAETKLWRDLATEIDNGVSHAYFLVTPDSVAAHEIFVAAAQRILQTDAGGANFLKQIEQNAHPDVKFYPDAGKMNVKEVAALVADAYVKPIEGARKLYFLQEADGMSAAVQNKLLKTYEEPPDPVTIFLSAASETALLTTIRSRAKKLYLEPFRKDALKAELCSLGADEADAEAVSVTANGSLTDALRFAADAEFLQRYRAVFDLLLKLKKSSEIPAYLGSPLFLKENVSATFDFIERILWDALRVKEGAADAEFSGGVREDYLEIGSALSPATVAVASDLINEARKKLSLNISPASASETLLFGILEAKFKWQS